MDGSNGLAEFEINIEDKKLKRNGTLALGLYNDSELVYAGDTVLNESGFLDRNILEMMQDKEDAETDGLRSIDRSPTKLKSSPQSKELSIEQHRSKKSVSKGRKPSFKQQAAYPVLKNTFESFSNKIKAQQQTNSSSVRHLQDTIDTSHLYKPDTP